MITFFVILSGLLLINVALLIFSVNKIDRKPSADRRLILKDKKEFSEPKLEIDKYKKAV